MSGYVGGILRTKRIYLGVPEMMINNQNKQ